MHMSGKPESLQNITMAGGGEYSLATRGAEDVINKSIPLVIDALNTMSITEEMADFTFSDIGTADGGTSLQLVDELIKTIRKKQPHEHVEYWDLRRGVVWWVVESTVGSCPH